MSFTDESEPEPKTFDWSKVSMPCPKCGGTLVVRTNRANGARFLGCTNWPLLCAHTAPIPEYVRVRASGAETLPGFDV